MLKILCAFMLFFSVSITAGPLNKKFFSIPRLRGFNLLEKFHKSWSNGPFHEEDFKMISEFGFNFVRLPMDYRTWCIDDNPEKIDEKVLKDIDNAVRWGQRYKIHVCINFHRGPGYTVAEPPEPYSLWTDRKMRRLFIKHWSLFAKRYKKIPSSDLSFNLLNEPAGDENARKSYIEVVRETVKAIRKISPDRFIICDGFNYGREYLSELEDLDIIQSCRGYEPFQLTHYMASWVGGSKDWPVPVWPVENKVSCFLYGPDKKEYQRPLIIKGDFPAKTVIKINIHQVSALSRLIIKEDSDIIFDKVFLPKDGKGEWKKVVYMPQWGIYQNIYDREYETKTKKKSKDIIFENIEGDWLFFNSISINYPDGRTIVIRPDSFDWGAMQKGILIEKDLSIKSLLRKDIDGKEWLTKNVFENWFSALQKGNAIIVGEWGAYQFTSHDVVLRWMEDNLSLWKEYNIGWALWNFRGSFGVLDSNRTDVEYEKINGHLLDRKMLELLKSY